MLPSWTHEDTTMHARERDRSPEERRARHFNSSGDEASFASGAPPLLHVHSRREPGEEWQLPDGVT
ncbi:hypothetical protein M9458_021049, partial [Cirrhinus mrigala]